MYIWYFYIEYIPKDKKNKRIIMLGYDYKLLFLLPIYLFMHIFVLIITLGNIILLWFDVLCLTSGKVTIIGILLSLRLNRTGKRQLSSHWRDMRHVYFIYLAYPPIFMHSLFLTLLHVPSCHLFVRLLRPLQTQIFHQPTQSVLALLSIFLSSTMR